MAVEVNERGPAGEFELLEEVFFEVCVFVVVMEVGVVVFLEEVVRGESVLVVDFVVVLENVGAGEVGVFGCCCVCE